MIISTIRTCIFCESPIPKRNNPEHILLNALGGRMTTTVTTCPQCNNHLGASIDKELAQQFLPIRNLLSLETGKGAKPPAIRDVISTHGSLKIGGDGKLTLLTKPFLVLKKDSGEISIDLKTQSMAQLRKLLPDIAAAAGISKAKLIDELCRNPFVITTTRPDVGGINMSFGGHEAFRAAAKACLTLRCETMTGLDQRGILLDCINFVREGSVNFLKLNTSLDNRPIPNCNLIADRFGPIFNLIYVCSDSNGRVLGHVTFYSMISFQFLIADYGGIPNLHHALISNPLDNKIWSSHITEYFTLDPEWIAHPEYSDEGNNRITTVMNLYEKRATPQAVGDLITSLFDHLGMADDEPLDQNMLEFVSNELMKKVHCYLTHIPYKLEIPKDILRRILSS